MKKIDLIGQRFGKLMVIEEVGRNKWGNILWKCLCDCGDIAITVGSKLKSGHTKSCGCLNFEKGLESKIIHGMSGTPTYWSWRAMMQRCNNSHNNRYEIYGDRGIIICERWHKFENFLEDMGPRPNGLTLERKK